MKRILAALLIIASVFVDRASAELNSKSTELKQITIISTSDVHGWIDGYNYLSKFNLPIGLDRVSSIIKNEKKKDKNIILLDAGDFNRGNPMTDLYSTIKLNEDNPIVNIMNLMGYDAAIPGNHELDYGMAVLLKIRGEADFPILSANIFYNNKLLFEPYEVIEKKGIKIGIVGFTTTAALKYNSGDDIEGIEVKNISKQAAQYLDILKNKEKADIIIAVIHSGIEGTYKAPENETDAIKLSELPIKPDVIISGHSHRVIPSMVSNGVLIQSPGAMGIGAGKIQLYLQNVDGKWNIIKKAGHFIPAPFSSGDPELKNAINGYRDTTTSYVGTQLGRIETGIKISGSDLINMVKQKDADSDIVIGEVIKESRITKNITVGDMYKLYGRENYIVGVKSKGKNLREYVMARIKSNPANYNNIYGLSIINRNDGIELRLGDKKIDDGDDIKIALTGRQLKYDANVKKSGISSGIQYYNSFEKYGLDGRVRTRLMWYIKNSKL
jgi:2',3'-cyclic-nucleotide 2'-phosphodiesterase (5'-nucleotidase family)